MSYDHDEIKERYYTLVEEFKEAREDFEEEFERILSMEQDEDIETLEEMIGALETCLQTLQLAYE